MKMKMTKEIEVTVCEECGSEVHEFYHLSLTIYDYQDINLYKDLDDNLDYSSFGTPKVTNFPHGAWLQRDKVKKPLYDLVEHEIIADFCDWECFVKYIKGDVNGLQET